jgi:hypothetical protein
VSHLLYVSKFSHSEDLLEEARTLDIIPSVEPRAFERGDGIEFVVDNDPRFGA